MDDGDAYDDGCGDACDDDVEDGGVVAEEDDGGGPASATSAADGAGIVPTPAPSGPHAIAMPSRETQFLLAQHPEVFVPPADALRAGPPLKTSPFLTHYERVKVLALRASQLAQGAPPTVPRSAVDAVLDARYGRSARGVPPLNSWPPDVSPFGPPANYVDDTLATAMAELDARVLPFILRRPLCNGAYEYVRLAELDLL